MRSGKSVGSGAAKKPRDPLMPGPDRSKVSRSSSVSTSSTRVVERSGYSMLPSANASKPGTAADLAMNAKAADAGSVAIGAPVWNFSQPSILGAAASVGSSQIGVSKSSSVSASAAAATPSG